MHALIVNQCPPHSGDVNRHENVYTMRGAHGQPTIAGKYKSIIRHMRYCLEQKLYGFWANTIWEWKNSRRYVTFFWGVSVSSMIFTIRNGIWTLLLASVLNDIFLWRAVRLITNILNWTLVWSFLYPWQFSQSTIISERVCLHRSWAVSLHAG